MNVKRLRALVANKLRELYVPGVDPSSTYKAFCRPEELINHSQCQKLAAILNTENIPSAFSGLWCSEVCFCEYFTIFNTDCSLHHLDSQLSERDCIIKSQAWLAYQELGR